MTLTGPSGSGLDGTEDEMGLNAGHAPALPDARAPWVRAARRSGNAVRSRQAQDTGGGRNAVEVREWATAQGPRLGAG